jgi:protein phosphatase PTC7
MNYGAFAIPHYKKRKQGGEDCHFASDKLLVVIDGVGGWNQVGIDPSEYSRQLCSKYYNNY